MGDDSKDKMVDMKHKIQWGILSLAGMMEAGEREDP